MEDVLQQQGWPRDLCHYRVQWYSHCHHPDCWHDTESIGSIGDYIDLIDPEDAEYPSKIEQSFLDDPSDFAEPCPEPNRLLLHIREPNANKKLFDIVVPVKNIYISDVKQMICEKMYFIQAVPGIFYAEPPFEGKYLLGSRFARSALNHHLDVHF